MCLAVASCGGGSGSGGGGGDTDGSTSTGWETLQDGLPGAILSVWGSGSDDIWVASATGDGGPNAQHFDGTAWTDLTLPVTTDLWWVYGPDTDSVWFVGEQSVVLRHERATGATVEIQVDEPATFFGIWGMDDTMYTVGGVVPAGPDDPPIIVRITGDEATVVTDLPAGLDSEELWFKVWGSALDDVWVIGDRGTILHFDGSAWSRKTLPDSPRLVTINGSGPDDVVVVGSSVGGAIFELDESGSWTDATPPSANPLNGVYVTAGLAATAGTGGTVLERSSSGWRSLAAPSVIADWHAVWIDEQHRIYVGGGDLVSLENGTLLRYDGTREWK